MKKLLIILTLFISFILNTANYSFAQNIPWEKPGQLLTYIPPNNKYTDLMKQAFAQWTKSTNGKIVFRYVQDPAKAQIKVRFVKDAAATSKMENALGVTYSKFKTTCIENQCSTYMYHADIDIANNAPNGGLLLKDAVYRVMLHEIGHSIGLLDHSADPLSIMYPQKKSRNATITDNDLKLLYRLYGWSK